jgi:predicted RNA-binding Zn ribbon-like protein
MSNLRPDPIFIADAKGVDFLNSIATPVDVPIEWLGSGEDLLKWLKQADLVPTNVLNGFRSSATPGELDGVAAEARSLREWFRGFVNTHKGRPLKPNALQQVQPLNRILERDDSFGQIVVNDEERDGPSGLKWIDRRRWRSPESLLLPIAREIAHVICDEDFSLVRACEGHTCTLMFVDRTKSHRRRWCSMAVCGNRAKQAALRERLR